ncbi:BTAD domain-containing putative transcriptional regulator [Actinoplanes oblitus]|uniref:BTAD domain-containing putative transcriptional regulator n=1 Tax=Actinoplanes oblitus TaxID=3040509 RepID=A0ABY8WC71_9ACTN|nr:AfsR/SARP family transcriptional regulator [Actinoplanes oblitus]WIM94520.1 BTAD domain-containing putative transcriptional regulator [Actinoplanes oblitus]
MRFLTLGPLSISDEKAYPISAAKHRGLLAILLINVNRAVTVAHLVDELWPDDPPVTAQNLVRQYVSHLRRFLTDALGDTVALQTHAAGYMLVVDRSTLDVAEFERLGHAARTELAAGRPDEAKSLIGAALRLWRGQAYSDVPDGPSVTAERVRLEELYAGMLELEAESDLAAGRVSQSISELTSLTVRFPLHERLYVLLMRALTRAGRKADALAVYRDARAVLVGEVGLEPGPELRRAEQEVFDERPAADTAPAGPLTVQPAVVPAQLPAPLPDFVGRTDLIGAVTGTVEAGLRAENAPVIVLSGLGGVGKTALAVRLGHQLRESFPDGQIFLRLTGAHREPVDPAGALGRLLEVLGCPPADQPAGLWGRQDRFRSILATRRILLILDDAADADQVGKLLPGRTPGAVMVTSRGGMAELDGAHHIRIPAFGPGEALSLLGRLAGPNRTGAEPTAARAIADACGHLPLAVRVAGLLAAMSPGLALRHLEQRLSGGAALDELVLGNLDVKQVVGAAYDQLRPGDRQVLRQLACDTADGTGRPAPTSGWRHAVDRLVDSGMLEMVPAGHTGFGFRCPELLRRYVQRCTEPSMRYTSGVPAPAAAPTRLRMAV